MFKKTAVTAAVDFHSHVCGGVWKAAAHNLKRGMAAKRKPLNAYRLDFSVNEMEDGKKDKHPAVLMNSTLITATNLKSTRVRSNRTAASSSTLMWDKHLGRIEERSGAIDLSVRARSAISRIPNRLGTRYASAIAAVEDQCRDPRLVGKPMLVGSVDILIPRGSSSSRCVTKLK